MPGWHDAVTSHLAAAVHCASQLPCTETSAWHAGGCTTRAIWKGVFSAAMYVLRTLQAALAVVCVVSSARSALMSLQTLSHWASTPVAAVSRAPTASAHSC